MAWGVPEIRGWLLQHPRPVTLKVVASDDRHHEVSVGGSWMAIAQSVHALSPTLIECHDEKGKIIRAVRPQDDDNTGEAKQAMPLQLQNVDPQSAQLILRGFARRGVQAQHRRRVRTARVAFRSREPS